MAEHYISFSLPELEMGKVDANFYIYKDGERLGRITISRGGLDYYPKNKKIPIKVSWSSFDKMLKNYRDE